MAEYSFRIRFNLPEGTRINIAEPTWTFGPVDGVDVSMRPLHESTIGKSGQLSCRASGFTDEQSARSTGERVRDILTLAFAHARVPADFGDRAPRSYITPAGLAMLEKERGGRVLHDYHGLQVFVSDPVPSFTDFNVNAVVGRAGDALKAGVTAAIDVAPQLDAAVRTAFDLFSASAGVRNSDSRFLLLMMAVETLTQQQPRSEHELAHVDALVKATEAADLTGDEKKSLLSSLQWLRIESVGAAGRRLARSLGSRLYGDLAPDRFFMKCYDMRGQLVHGYVPRPDHGVVGTMAAQLEQFVGDLIALPLLPSLHRSDAER